MPDGPLERARAALQEARARQEHSPSGPNNKALEEARAHMDYLLDTLPIPAPSSPVPHRPGLEVSYAVNTTGQAEQVVTLDELLDGDSDGCMPTTQQDTGNGEG